MKTTGKYRRLATMVDCSRNANMKMDTFKKWIDLTADMGYDTVMLYMEDTYEIENHPYFGYGRARYTKEELREIDEYAASKGLEAIPCIQTLAHLKAIFSWPQYLELNDCFDILLIGEEKVYELIDAMFASLSQCFKSKYLHIGMDEARLVGRGTYYEKHGDTNKGELLISHMNRVSEIAKKYGYKLLMWSDTFMKVTAKSDGSDEAMEKINAMLPDNIELVYWNYWEEDAKVYDDELQLHNKIKGDTWFAGGVQIWSSFAPCNLFSIETTKKALAACEKYGVKDIMITLWGDDGSECSKFAAIPALFYLAEYMRGNRNEESIKEKFKEKIGIAFDDFLLLDLNSNGKLTNPSKYILFNDLFNGFMDMTITETAKEDFRALSAKLTAFVEHPEWGYLFANAKALCDVAVRKCDLGIKIRKAYAKKDKEELKLLVTECKEVKALVEKFYDTFERLWMHENKANGFDAQDIRLGGIITRIGHCAKRIEQYVNGEIAEIDELHGEQLDFFGNGTKAVREDNKVESFKNIYTANVLHW